MVSRPCGVSATNGPPSPGGGNPRSRRRRSGRRGRCCGGSSRRTGTPPGRRSPAVPARRGGHLNPGGSDRRPTRRAWSCRAGWRDDRHHSSAADVERHAVRSRRVSPANVKSTESTWTTAAPSGGGDRQRRIGLDRFVEHLADPSPAGERERHLREHVADQPEREHQEREQVDEAGQFPDGEDAAAHAVGTEQDQAHVGQRGEGPRAAPRRFPAAARRGSLRRAAVRRWLPAARSRVPRHRRP